MTTVSPEVIEYKIADRVLVEMPDGLRTGHVATVLKNYDWQGDTKYSIHGKGFVTIASARIMSKVSNIEQMPLTLHTDSHV